MPFDIHTLLQILAKCVKCDVLKMASRKYDKSYGLQIWHVSVQGIFCNLDVDTSKQVLANNMWFPNTRRVAHLSGPSIVIHMTCKGVFFFSPKCGRRKIVIRAKRSEHTQ